MTLLRNPASLACIFLSIELLLYLSGMRIVMTPSVPMGLYSTRALSPDVAVRVGDYVCLPPVGEASPMSLREAFRMAILPDEWRWRPFLKRVAAVEGDLVSYDGGVRVNGRLLPASQAVEHDRHGRPLPHPTYPRRLAHGEVWLTSEHPRGFDSRYFGPVQRRALTCVGGPLWTI